VLGIFDSELQQHKGKIPFSLSKQLQAFVLKEVNWDTIVSTLTASEENEEEEEQTSSEKSNKSSQGGRKSLPIITPTTDLMDDLNEVFF
jgi:hypothetical protein